MEEDENESEIKTTITQSRSGSQILHVHQNSANELDQLFDAALNPNMKSKSLPMKLRKLPKSFFQQPDRPRRGPQHGHSRSMGGLVSTPINHSRNSSTDSSASHHSGILSSSSNLQQQSIHMNNPMGQRTDVFNQGLVQQQQHPFNSPTHVGLQQVTQISHSRSKSSPASLQMMNANLHLKVQQQSTAEIPPDMPLPQGWEVAKTQDGQTYFMNHANRTTTWNDPRIAILKEQQERANATNMQTSNHPQSPIILGNLPAEQTVAQQVGSLPHGWEQATTPHGEIYFINHDDRTTSWTDPRLSQNTNHQHANQSQLNAQMQHQLRKMNQLDINAQFGQRSMPGNQMMLKQLAKDKEIAMKLRHQEMMKQSGMDPFLSTGSPATAFNHPRENDEYLGGAEEMETDSGNHNQQIMNQQQPRCMTNVQQQQRQQHVLPHHSAGQHQGHFPDFLDSLPASSVDFGTDGGNPQTNALDEEELMPSISEALSPDYINDVESMLNPVVKSENMDSMTWI